MIEQVVHLHICAQLKLGYHRPPVCITQFVSAEALFSSKLGKRINYISDQNFFALLGFEVISV